MKKGAFIGVLAAFVAGLRMFAAEAGAPAGFEDGWKWFKHRQAERAPGEELLDILKTLKHKYEGTSANMTGVDQEIRRYTKNFSVPRQSASHQAAYNDGWKWYQHRKSQRAPEKELVDILQTLKKKYGDLGVDVSQATSELARYGGGVAPSVPGSPATSAPLPPRPAASAEPSRIETIRDPREAPPSPAMWGSGADKEAVFQQRLRDVRSSDAKVRLNAVRDLKEMRDPRSVESLVPLLDDPDNFVAIVAASALVQVGEPALPPLLVAAESEKTNVRLVTCVALGDLGHPNAAPVLEKLSADQSGEVREAARNALNKIRSASSQKRWKEREE